VQLNVIADHVARVDAWLESLRGQAERFAIVYHGDCDGAVSAALFEHLLWETMDVADVRTLWVRTEQYDFEEALAALRKYAPDATIFLDLSIQNHPHKLRRVAEHTRLGTLVYDHHRQEDCLLPDQTLYLNPSITPEGHTEDSAPPCLFAARLAQRRIGRDFDWAACIGLIAEAGVERFLPLFRKLPQQFPRLFSARRIHSPEDVHTSKIRDITYAIGSAFWAEPGGYEASAYNVLTRMVTAYSLEPFFDPLVREAVKLIVLEKAVRAEIGHLTTEAEYNSFQIPDAALRYSEICSDYRVGGVVASRLARRYKDDIVVTGQEYHGRYLIEARCGARRRDDLALLLRQATKGLEPFSHGGHPAAAGASLPPASSPQFYVALEEAARDLRRGGAAT
jgi:single-stranded DNA-specific DHH superfamily exonuclease